MPYSSTRRQHFVSGMAKPKNTFENALAHLAITLGNAMHASEKNSGSSHIDIITPGGSVRLEIDMKFSRTPAGQNPNKN